MRPRAKVLLGAALATALLAVVALGSIGPLARWRLRAEGAQRGLEIAAGAVRPSFGRLWVRDVTVRAAELPSLEARIDHLEVELGFTLSVRRVVLHGGVVTVQGPFDRVRRELQAWRAKPRSEPRASREGGPEIAIHGMAAEWREPWGPSSELFLWGIRAVRSAGALSAAADLARVVRPGIIVNARGPHVTVSSRAPRQVVESVGADALAALLDLDQQPAPAGLTDASAQPPGTRSPSAAAVGVAANPAPGAGMFAAIAAIPGDQRGPRVRRVFADVAGLCQRLLPGGASLTLDQLFLGVRRGGQVLEIGPGRLRVSRDDHVVRVALEPGDESRGAPLRLSLSLPLGTGPIELKLTGGPTSLAALGVDEGSFGLIDVHRSELRLDAKLRLSADGALLHGEGLAELDQLGINSRALSREPLKGAKLRWNGRWNIALDASLLELEDGVLTVGTVPVELGARLERRALGSEGMIRLRVPLASCQGMLEAAPAGLLPLLSGARMDGTFALDTGVEFDTSRPSATKVKWHMAQDCRPVSLPGAIDPQRFKSSWTRDVIGADRQRLTLTSGPASPGWVPLRGISKHVETAVLVCEDGRFFRHRGFDDEAIANSIRDNINLGRFARGASTISMQLAKNLYLPREKTLSRKLQEAVLTVVLEQSLSKDELMELYLNVIEFGPGIYGIGPAAAFYFESPAADLSLGQSLYLASILPNPWQQHFDSSGQVSAGWSSYLQKLMHIARKIGRIDDQELEEALAERVAFKVPYPKAPEAGAADGADAAEAGASLITPASAEAGP